MTRMNVFENRKLFARGKGKHLSFYSSGSVHASQIYIYRQSEKEKRKCIDKPNCGCNLNFLLKRWWQMDFFFMLKRTHRSSSSWRNSIAVNSKLALTWNVRRRRFSPENVRKRARHSVGCLCHCLYDNEPHNNNNNDDVEKKWREKKNGNVSLQDAVIACTLANIIIFSVAHTRTHTRRT